MTYAEKQLYEVDTLLQFAKMWDLLVSKAMLAMFLWTMFVSSTGLTFLEYKNWSTLNALARAKEAAVKAGNKEEKAKLHEKKIKNLMKFHYGFATKTESYQRIFKTDNIYLGFLFTDWAEDPKLQAFNGTEWTTLFYWN